MPTFEQSFYHTKQGCLGRHAMIPRSPDFICIGAQKAGTWWLRENLRLHPRVWMPPVPELHYFDEPLEGPKFLSGSARERLADEPWRKSAFTEMQRLVSKGDAEGAAWWALYAFCDYSAHWYRSLYSFAPPGYVTGDVTPRYMLCGPSEIDHMHHVAPDAKIVVLVRHPVDRFWSQCKMMYARKGLPPGDPAAMRMLDTSNGRPRGEYSKAILRFCRVFGPDRMLVVFHEGIVRQPAAVMAALHDFLGLPPVPLDQAQLCRVTNKSASDEPMPDTLRARVTAAYRAEMQTMADIFGGYAVGWVEGTVPEGTAPVIRVTPGHIEALGERALEKARQRAARGKIFCVSMQRSGTTSVGDWLESHGLTRAGSPTSVRLEWSRLWMQGDYEAIFASAAFRDAEILEDDPWWCPGFFRVVAERFPDAKFILLERDPDAWFDSMCHHSGGRNPGWTDIHARIYGREKDLEELLRKQPAGRPDAWSQLSIVEHREHYKTMYRQHCEAVRSYFRDQPDRLFVGRLDDPDVFQGMCHFVGVVHDRGVSIPRSNASTEAMRQSLKAHVVKGNQ